MAWLQEHGWPRAERRTKQGRLDRGDVAGVVNVVVECKNERTITLAKYVDEAEVERQNDKARWAVVCVPRRNHAVGDGYFIMRIEDGFALLREWGESR